jgi:hypothetical protein
MSASDAGRDGHAQAGTTVWVDRERTVAFMTK